VSKWKIIVLGEIIIPQIIIFISITSPNIKNLAYPVGLLPAILLLEIPSMIGFWLMSETFFKKSKNYSQIKEQIKTYPFSIFCVIFGMGMMVTSVFSENWIISFSCGVLMFWMPYISLALFGFPSEVLQDWGEDEKP